jgi:hypothetical protein
MNTPLLFTNTSDALLCPVCGADTIHLDDVYVAGRTAEDGPVTELRIDSRGEIHHETIPLTWGRRHSIGVGGYCENGGHRFIIEFMQHKGATLTEIRPDGHQW